MKYEYDTDAYLKQISNSNSYFNTFLDKKSLAAGVLSLDPGEEDTQEPHESDEMYYVLKGNGFLRINKNDYKLKEIQAGTSWVYIENLRIIFFLFPRHRHSSCPFF